MSEVPEGVEEFGALLLLVYVLEFVEVVLLDHEPKH